MGRQHHDGLGLFLALILGNSAAVNMRPVVGIYAAPLHHLPSSGCPDGCDYVAASYVKWLESAGAQSVPIPYNASVGYVDGIFPQLDGILFPGGGANLPVGAKRLFELALRANDNGTHFPGA